MRADLEAHPIADMFPLIEGAAFDELVASIKTHGLINPIILHQGKILDGRNRYRACVAAGVEPNFVEFDNSDPAKWAGLIDALNMQRRHLNDSQRAILAAQLFSNGTSLVNSAKALNVSARTVSKAVGVMRSGDTNVIDLVQRGKTTVTKAEAVLKGELPRSALEDTGRRVGRPSGDTHIRKLRKAVAELLALGGSKETEKIVRNWPGDPALNADVKKCIEFLRSLSNATQEADGATALA